MGRVHISQPACSPGILCCISCQRLREEGLLKYEDREEYVPDRADCVDYDAVRANKETLLRKCFQQSEERLQKELAQFARENDWVEDFALFIALKQRFGGGMWTKWPDADIRLRKSEALQGIGRNLMVRCAIISSASICSSGNGLN